MFLYRLGRGSHPNCNLDAISLQVILVLLIEDPPKKYNAPLPLNPLKLKDLKSFVPDLVPAEYLRKYWNTILQSSPADINQNDDEDLALNFDRASDYN